MDCKQLTINAGQLNDIQAGDLFAEEYHDRVRFVKERNQWALYTGKRWEFGANHEIMELSKILVSRTLPVVAGQIADNDERTRVFQWIAKLQSNKSRDEMLKSARSKNGILESTASFDANNNLLNLNNGILDLERGTLLPHNPESMLSKFTNVYYDVSATCPRWDQFISEIMPDKPDLSEFLQKSVGYALLGNPVEDCMFVLYGPSTRNGKGTFCHAMLDIFGDYATESAPETIAINRNKVSSAATPDLARLNNVRFVNMAEPSEGMELDAAVVKRMTGRDLIVTRNLNEGIFTYTPKFVIFMNANALPIIHDTTIFTSNRMMCIPFDVQFPEGKRDTGLQGKFSTPEAKSAILNWTIEGLKLYKDKGLRSNTPQIVKAAVKEYEEDSDTFGSFLNTWITKHPLENDEHNFHFANTKDIYQKYDQWARSRNYKPMSETSMVLKMKRRGYKSARKNQRMGFKFVSLNATEMYQLSEDEQNEEARLDNEFAERLEAAVRLESLLQPCIF